MESNILEKSLHELVNEGLHNKLVPHTSRSPAWASGRPSGGSSMRVLGADLHYPVILHRRVAGRAPAAG